MKIKQISEKSILLTLPTKQRYLGLFLTILGVIIPIFLYFLNGNNIRFTTESDLKVITSILSLGYLLGYIFVFEVPSIYYFFSIHNKITSYGHILLLTLNIIAYIGTYSSIFSLVPILITGIYFLTHFKTININQGTSTINFHERILFLFFTNSTIPFSEIKELVLEYRVGIGHINRTGKDHQIKLYVLEADPGLKDTPIAVEDEKESLEFYRPQTLRKTLISKPTLIDSSLFNIYNHKMVKIKNLFKQLKEIIGFSQSKETIDDKKILNISKK